MPFLKGHHFNKGRKLTEEHKRKIGLSNSISLKGRKLSAEVKKKIGLSNIGKHTGPNTESWKAKIRKSTKLAMIPFSNELHYLWKGNDASYEAKHNWLYRRKSKADKCQNRIRSFLGFRCSGTCDTFQWANLSRKYLRDVNDYVQLCCSCHAKFDSKKYRSISLKAFN